MALELSAAEVLPEDGTAGTLIGRAWRPGRPGGPAVVVIEDGEVMDITRDAPTLAHVLEAEAPLELLRAAREECRHRAAVLHLGRPRAPGPRPRSERLAVSLIDPLGHGRAD